MQLSKGVLIIDDEENIRSFLGRALARDGFAVETAQYGKEGIGLFARGQIDVVLLDLNLPDLGGLEVLKRIKELDPRVVTIIITAYGDIGSAVEAMRLGAYDYITKPFEVDDIKIVINRALHVAGLEDRIRLLEQQVDRYQFGEIIAVSRKMRELLEFAESVAATPTTVMIHGETGTGKELIASFIHRKSARAEHTFVTIDCTTLPEPLLESELFGHERGAFTGATGQKKGLFEVANGGTVFLDEISELPIALQAKILRVMENKAFRRVGGERYLDTDVRVIVATNRDLKRMVEEKRFRSDLFYRLNVVPIHLPPLKERRKDIFPLINYFVALYNKKIGRNISEVSEEALRLLINYTWPGNVREVRNVIEHLVITCQGEVITVSDLPTEVRHKAQPGRPAEGLPLSAEGADLPDFREAKKEAVEAFERDYLRRLLERNGWNVSQSARRMKMHRSSLQRLLRKYGIKKK